MRRLLIIFVITLMTSDALAGNTLQWVRRNPGPSARQQAAQVAMREVWLAQSAFGRAYAQASRDNPLAQQVVIAMSTLARANARRTVMIRDFVVTLGAQEDVRQLSDQIVSLERQLERETDIKNRLQLAHDLLNTRSQRTKLIQAAIDDNTALTLSKADVLDANTALRELQQRHRATLDDNPTFAGAKARLVAARGQLASID